MCFMNIFPSLTLFPFLSVFQRKEVLNFVSSNSFMIYAFYALKEQSYLELQIFS